MPSSLRAFRGSAYNAPVSHTPDRGASPAEWAVPGYLLEGALGHGGFGVVLAARRIADGRPAAVKIARPDPPGAREQLLREEEALRAIGPPLALELLDAGELAGGARFIALERIADVTLAARLAASGRLEATDAAAAALALAAALAGIHRAGWAHLDLKPGHVLLAGGAARLIDFGLAARPGDPAARAVVPEGGFAGTAEYMSPEQCRGDAADARADVYSAGAILFELLTGRPPFRGSPAELRQAHLALRVPRPSELGSVPAALEQVVVRCLAKEPAVRYRDGAELAAALQGAISAREVARAHAARVAPAALRRRRVGLLHFESAADVLAVRRTVEAAGGQLARAAGARFAAVFEPGAGDNAVRLALDAAAALARAGVAARAAVDLDEVAVLGAGAAARYLLPARRDGEVPGQEVAPGTYLTARAAAVVPELPAGHDPAAGALLRLPSRDTSAPRAPILGRGALLDALAADALADLEARRPAVVAVTGEPGIGKSHLGEELASRLRALPLAPDVLELRGREAAVGDAATTRELLAWALRLPPGAAPPSDGGRALLEPGLPPASGRDAWAPLALALGWLPAGAPALRSWRAAPGALRAATVRLAGEALRARVRERPLCVVLDDAHLADAAALDALEYAALAEASLPIVVCALGRPALAAARPALGERAARSRSLALGALDPAAAADLCRRLLFPADNVPARAVDRLVERARCVPMLLVELVRGLRAQGLVRQREGDGGWFVATDEIERVPDAPLVDWLAQRELGALPDALAAHGRLVALLGDDLARAEIGGVVAELDAEGDGPALALDPDVATDRLLELQVLSTRGGRVGFRNPVLREAVARSATEPERRAVHRAALRHYRAARDVPERERLPRLARHAEGCGERSEAAALWLGIAQDLRARHAYLEAEVLFTRALGQLGEGDASARLVARRGRGLVRYRLGRYDDAIGDLAAAEALARGLADAGAEIECLLDEATALDWMNDYTRSAERVAAAARLCGDRPSPLAAARLELARGRTLLRAARWAESAEALGGAATRAEALGDEGYETLVVALLLLGFVLPYLGRAAEAEQVLSRAHALATDRGDVLHVASALNNRRNVWVTRGDPERAALDQAAFLRVGRDLGMIGIEYVGEYNLGELLYQTGDLAGAGPHVARAVAIERRHPEVAARPLARLLQARLLAFTGELASASAALAEARAVEEGARRDERPGAILGPSDAVLAEMVEHATRDGGSDEGSWLALRARSRAVSVEQEPIEVCELHGLAALRAGRLGEARAALEEALRLSQGIPNVMQARVRASLARCG